MKSALPTIPVERPGGAATLTAAPVGLAAAVDRGGRPGFSPVTSCVKTLVGKNVVVVSLSTKDKKATELASYFEYIDKDLSPERPGYFYNPRPASLLTQKIPKINFSPNNTILTEAYSYNIK